MIANHPIRDTACGTQSLRYRTDFRENRHLFFSHKSFYNNTLRAAPNWILEARPRARLTIGGILVKQFLIMILRLSIISGGVMDDRIPWRPHQRDRPAAATLARYREARSNEVASERDA
jgi:hypothetical protein